MLKNGDKYRYTAPHFPGSICVIQNICGNIVTIETGGNTHLTDKNILLGILQSGHIKLIGTSNTKPYKFLKYHKLCPKRRNVPTPKKPFENCYIDSKLYEW